MNDHAGKLFTHLFPMLEYSVKKFFFTSSFSSQNFFQVGYVPILRLDGLRSKNALPWFSAIKILALFIPMVPFCQLFSIETGQNRRIGPEK